MHEPFRQWVLEDLFVDGVRPPWERAGVQFVLDVAPFEHAKHRMLNASHSALAYLGYLAGHETIFDAVSADLFARFIKRFWRDEVIPIRAAPPGLNLGQYADQLFERYSNPAIRHRLWQIAMDGSQKLPQRLLFHCPGQSQPETPFQARRARRSRLDALCLRRRRSRRNHRRPGSPSGSSSRPNRFRRSRPGGASASACDRRSGVRQRPASQ